jgi:branched-subunit amino acid aminotransferase/4-amino-4-deoxychorismate lyase
MDAARAADADEALLFDRQGRLVEGARSNIVIVDAQQRLLTPPLERGAVAGVALEVLRERIPLLERDITPTGLRAARAVFALNAVRGVRPIVRIDAATVHSDQHACAATLRAALERD